MTRRPRALLLVLAVLASACGGSIARENIDGVECVVIRKKLSGRPVFADCDWSTSNTSRPPR